jgi:hypothetical protein
MNETVMPFETRIAQLDVEGINVRGIGKDPQAVLQALASHGGWSRGSSWRWIGIATTIRLLDGLVRRGLAVTTTVSNDRGRIVRYSPAPAVVEVWQAYSREADAVNEARSKARRDRQDQENRQRRAEVKAVAALIEKHRAEYADLVFAALQADTTD